jgi:formate dehydrogenase major subunit
MGNSHADWEILVALAERMGHKDTFAFRSPEDIWNEIRAVWPAGRGITYARLDQGGLQWPCPTEDHPGTRILHQKDFAGRPRAQLECVPFLPATESVDEAYPLILITGRTLYQFNAGTMTLRTPNAILRPHDVLEMAPDDATRLALSDGQEVRVTSRYGDAILPLAVTDDVQAGEVFATFHTTRTFLNQVTGPYRDHQTDTPDYKVTAVRVAPA